MATIAPLEYPRPDAASHDGVLIYQWANMAAGDVGEALRRPRFSDRSVQVEGTLDGASVKIEGRLAGGEWAPLTDPQGNDISISSYPSGYASKIEAITEVVDEIRPRIVGGTSPSVTVSILIRS